MDNPDSDWDFVISCKDITCAGEEADNDFDVDDVDNSDEFDDNDEDEDDESNNDEAEEEDDDDILELGLVKGLLSSMLSISKQSPQNLSSGIQSLSQYKQVYKNSIRG